MKMYDTARSDEFEPYEVRFDHIHSELDVQEERPFVRERKHHSSMRAPYPLRLKPSGQNIDSAVVVSLDVEPIDIASHVRSEQQRLELLHELGEQALISDDPVLAVIAHMPSFLHDRGTFRDTLGV